MISTKYQLVVLGSHSGFRDDILKTLFNHIDELGIDRSFVNVIYGSNFTNYAANAPTFCIYFADKRADFLDLDLLSILQRDATLIFPVINDLNLFSQTVPKQLHGINGFQLSDLEDIERLVSVILEGLGLLRLSRRVFISYKRDESSGVAIQLFEALEKNGFDVFLDTHSIRPGEPFQDELWHRLADTDVVLLLNTPGFLNSHWTTQELAQANAMSIGILQLIWPTHKMGRDAELCMPYQLEAADFGDGMFKSSRDYLTDAVIRHVVSMTESLRARSLASRQDNITTEFIAAANRKNIRVELQPEKFITLEKSDGEELIFIPTVGVPQAFTYNQSEELVKAIKVRKIKQAYLLYDHRNIRERWIAHLGWLDTYLPIKAKKIYDAEIWLPKL